MDVRKTNGEIEAFDAEKLKKTICAAYTSVGDECSDVLLETVLNNLYLYDKISTAEIRRQVEEWLMSVNKKAAKEYIKFYVSDDELKKRGDFISDYIRATNASTGSVYDSNANVSNKNIATLNAEIPKFGNIKFNRKNTAARIKKLYSNKLAKQYISDLENHILYKHDESSFGVNSPYTYSAKEVVEVKYNGNHYVLPFDLLWKMVSDEEVLVDEEKCVYQKYPEDLFVRERNNEFVQITVLTRKKRHRPLVRVKTAFGEDVIVTDNHPMIIDENDINNTVEASKSVDCKQFKTDDLLTFGDVKTIDASNCPDISEYGSNYCVSYANQVSKRVINVGWNLGYFVGFFVGDGNYNNGNGNIVFTQKDRSVLERLNEILFETLGVVGRIRYKRDKTNCYTLVTSSSVVWWLLSDVFHVEDKAENKTLPINFLEYSEEFSKGLICGLIDSDGTVNGCQLGIRLSSRACILQTTAILRHFGYGVGNTIQNLPFSNNPDHYHTNYTLWGVNCSAREDSVYLGESFKLNKIKEKAKTSSLKYKKSGETNIVSVANINENDSFLGLNEYIYDITTESRCFSMNNLLVHNCVAIQSYPFLVDGLKGLGGLSAAPKNIDSYCGMFVNLIFAVSSQFAGAVACAGFFNMFDYFARKEWGDDYSAEANSFYKIGYKLRKLLNKSHYWTKDMNELASHDFGSEELNKLRDELVFESERPLTEDELKEWYENIKEDPGYTLKLGDGTRTIRGQIHQYFQQVVYGINQPAAARGFQSAFVNFGYFDKPYFEGMYGEYVFPDGKRPQWETVSFIQKEFMKWFNKERTRTVLTFPVETMSLLYVDGEYVDKEYAEFTAEMLSEGHSFFIYTSDSPDTLSSCCFSKDQKVLWKSSTDGVNLTTMEELHNMKWEPAKKNLRIFHNGSWVSGKTIKLPNRPMFKVVTENNKEFFMTDNHINVTLDGEKTTDKLSTDDYLMFNTMALNSVPENNEHLTYEQGFVVGAFLGDGSFGGEINGTIYETNFSQNKAKYEKMVDMINIANKQLGGESVAFLGGVYNNVYPVKISSKNLVAFIMKWTNWKRGVFAHNKELNLDCLLQSVEFRKGILDGWYNTDGGNSNRCYTTSKKLVECMEVLITSLGMQSIIDVSDRTTEKTGEKVIIRGEEYNRNYPLYCVRWYEPVNHRINRDKEHKWIKKNNSIYFKVKSIEEIQYTDDVYCVECKNEDEPYFTLPSGLITHNCRLSNKIQENTFTFTNGLTGEQTGSKSVITLNYNRIVQNYVREKYDGDRNAFKNDKEGFMDGLREYLIPILERVYKYHTAYNSILWELFDANMLPVYSAGFIHLNKQYLTLGINGMNEAWMFLNGKCKYDDDYIYFTTQITGLMKEQNALHKTRKEMFNTEFVPAENLGIKNYKWDKNDGYWVPEGRNCYTSYFFLPDDEEISVLDKMKLHGLKNVKSLDGGSACHLQLKEHLSFEQYKKLLDFAGKVGCNYWTVNVKNSECKNCGYISKDTIDTCPKCGGKDFDYWTRIIGYLRKVSDFNEGRQIEESKRVYS